MFIHINFTNYTQEKELIEQDKSEQQEGVSAVYDSNSCAWSPPIKNNLL